MTQPQPDRLDRIEALVESNARAIASNSEAIANSFNRLDRIEALVESNARAIAANSDDSRASVRDLVSMITTQADQAEIDRAEFRATVRQLLETLNQRFTSNGH
jgi:hypothetical protein